MENQKLSRRDVILGRVMRTEKENQQSEAVAVTANFDELRDLNTVGYSSKEVDSMVSNVGQLGNGTGVEVAVLVGVTVAETILQHIRQRCGDNPTHNERAEQAVKLAGENFAEFSKKVLGRAVQYAADGRIAAIIYAIEIDAGKPVVMYLNNQELMKNPGAFPGTAFRKNSWSKDAGQELKPDEIDKIDNQAQQWLQQDYKVANGCNNQKEKAPPVPVPVSEDKQADEGLKDLAEALPPAVVATAVGAFVLVMGATALRMKRMGRA